MHNVKARFLLVVFGVFPCFTLYSLYSVILVVVVLALLWIQIINFGIICTHIHKFANLFLHLFHVTSEIHVELQLSFCYHLHVCECRVHAKHSLWYTLYMHIIICIQQQKREKNRYIDIHREKDSKPNSLRLICI